MMGARRAAAITGTLLVLSPVSLAAAASAVRQYSGRTSQRAPLAFTISGGYLRKLRFTIYIRCPSRHIWRIVASNFRPIRITRGTFSQRFVARGGKGSATVSGSVVGRRVSGRLYDRTFEPKEHHFCTGTAIYDLGGPSAAAPPPSRRGKGHGRMGSTPAGRRPRAYERLHGLRGPGPGTTMPVANEWPTATKRTQQIP